MVLGDFAKIINAQNVQLEVDGAADEVITLYNLRTVKDFGINRRNTRGGAVDTPTYAIKEIIADATVSQDVYNFFDTQSEITPRGGFDEDTFTITGEAISDDADNVVISGTYYVRRLETLGAERGQYDINLTLRIKPDQEE